VNSWIDHARSVTAVDRQTNSSLVNEQILRAGGAPHQPPAHGSAATHHLPLSAQWQVHRIRPRLEPEGTEPPNCRDSGD